MSLRHCLDLWLFAWWPARTSASGEEQTIRVSRAKGGLHAGRACGIAATPCPMCMNVLICFGQHREKISNRCRAVLASYGLQ